MDQRVWFPLGVFQGLQCAVLQCALPSSSGEVVWRWWNTGLKDTGSDFMSLLFPDLVHFLDNAK